MCDGWLGIVDVNVAVPSAPVFVGLVLCLSVRDPGLGVMSDFLLEPGPLGRMSPE